MATLTASGKKIEAKQLLSELGTSRLSEVNEADYNTLVTLAEALING